MIRIIVKFFVAIVFATLLHVGSLFAAPDVYISPSGKDANACTTAEPCATFDRALAVVDNGGQITCVGSPTIIEGGISFGISVTIDCPGLYADNGAVFGAFVLQGTNQTVKLRNLTVSGAAGGNPAILVQASGNLIIENCVFENIANGPALQITPNGPFNLVMTNSRVSNSGSGVLLQPGLGGSMTATFDGVTIVDNTGGGLKTDTGRGAVRVDISNSTISNNAGNGLNAVSGAGGANMLDLKNDVIAGNGTAGVQANGSNAAALVDMTLLDSNASGATSIVAGGRVLTYGNNHIVGSAGSGFTGTAPSQ
jgi:hypothetical protein